ncbi:MAG: NADH-quinone oxidoreductase subunit L [Chloroflexi bacterium]|nr:NADH-quinone oxidoreductase subunit L [Chloroflexota bacterium]
MQAQLWTILGLPLMAFVVIVFFTRRSKDLSSFVAIGAMFGSMLLAYATFIQVAGGARAVSEFEWLRLFPAGASEAAGESGTALRLGIQADPLTALMLVVVTTVSFLVQVYSRGYMVEHGHKDPGFSRFFAYLSLFTFSMLGLVLANNLLFLFISWELVGLSSYLLIGFWYQKPEAWIAAKKAFITTRIGDIGFLIGLLILWNVGGSLQFTDLFEQADLRSGALFNASLLGQPVLFWACLGLFAGAVGKSGQFPLHVWLPDAMEGPTPVSALIHAATMVAAGVYLVARTFPLFEAVPQALSVVAFIGGFTAIFAGTMGLVNNDMKRVMAFSTVSQLGYMMLALGAGSIAAAMFHLFTHAFFKALLFLSAGSVIHATETNDVREMGGLRRKMPITFATMLIGSLSLAGFPLLSGFWSKDEILVAASENANVVLFAFAMLTVFLTAFYTFRMFFLTFAGAYRGHHHPHESPPVMTVPLILLAIPAAAVGLWGSPWMGFGFQRFLEGDRFREPVGSTPVMLTSVVLGLAGIGLAYAMYGMRQPAINPRTVGARSGGLYTLLLNRWYVDELYMWILDKLAIGTGAVLAAFDRQVLDGAINALAELWRGLGSGLRGLQSGRVQNYGLYLFGGVAAIAFALLVAQGGMAR